ncbi:MAG: EAL domain-containing protein, partial [Spirochaetota bacterium]
AKRQGRNTYRFHNPGMNENAHRRLAMQGSIASAIDKGELSVVYQPILALADNRIAGAEALVRWTRDGRLISPGEFLPFLENSSMLTRLDLWVLDQVCLEINTLDSEHPGTFFVSVNAGAYNLIQDDFVHRVTETVARNGVDPTRIAIEVTESAAIRNFDRARATLRDLQSAGFRLYLDDFGEGHSSIRYLREFGVDSVKLDRAYLQNVERSESARSLVSGFTQLAHGMRLEAVIEGVETPGQLDFIRQAGCDYAQGFLVGRPGDLREALRADVGSLPSDRTE